MVVTTECMNWGRRAFFWYPVGGGQGEAEHPAVCRVAPFPHSHTHGKELAALNVNSANADKS